MVIENYRSENFLGKVRGGLRARWERLGNLFLQGGGGTVSAFLQEATNTFVRTACARRAEDNRPIYGDFRRASTAKGNIQSRAMPITWRARAGRPR